MAHAPLVLKAGEDDDRVEFCDEGHELTADAGVQEHGGDFVFELEGLVDLVLFVIDRSEVDDIFLNKDPLVLLNRESVDQIQLSAAMAQLDILHDFPPEVDEVDPILAQTHDIRLSLLLLLQKGNTEQVQIFIIFVLGERKPMMHDGSILLQVEDDDLRLLPLIGPGLNIGAESVEVVSEGQIFEVFGEGYLAFADDVHGELIVEVDVVILFLEDVGVVVGIEEDQLDVREDGLDRRGDYLHLIDVGTHGDYIFVWFVKMKEATEERFYK